MKYVVTVNGTQYEVEVEREGNRSSLLSRRPPERTAVQGTASPVVTRTVETVSTSSTGTTGSVVSPLPGTVLDVKINVGDTVTVGQVVLILEAMKMETEIVSEYAGTVSAIKVKKGDTVETDTVLVEIK